MRFEYYLNEQLRLHPSMQPQDIMKLCYQAERGAEHLLANTDHARKYLESEFASVEAMSGVLHEPISDNVCRVDLPAWKASGMPMEWLFNMFAASCSINDNADEMFAEYVAEAERFVKDASVTFTTDMWADFMAKYRQAGMPAVHHSEEYRKNEYPAYRIVKSELARAIPILEKINKLSAKDGCIVIAIDGRAASGKTTLAEQLCKVLDADVIHMDDFFLPPSLRTETRLAEPGGNIHYERFTDEVLPLLSCSEALEYRIFDCSIMDYSGTRKIGSKKFRIIEGSYSCHPIFGEYADITAFCDIDAAEQEARILKRNGEKWLGVFKERWIPMEERYFKHFGIIENADVII